MRTQCVSAGQHREVLMHDGVEQRGHELIVRDTLLLQSVDVGFGKDSAFPCDGMQLDAEVSLIAELLAGDLQFGVDLVDDSSRAASALVVHGRNLLLTAAGLVLFEDDDLGVLATELYHRVHFGMELLDGKRHCRDFLNELCSEQRSQRAASGTRNED